MKDRLISQYLVSFDTGMDAQRCASQLLLRACRVDFTQPGFALAQLGMAGDSRGFRQFLLEVMDELSQLCERSFGVSLFALSMSRFDQQTTTKPHRDGGPRDSLLLLGYEPTSIESRLSMVDYSRCAHNLGISPSELLERHNPMFSTGADVLAGYETAIKEFDSAHYQILLVNNSCGEYAPESARWQGVLHQATVPHPSGSAVRVVNSIQLTPDAQAGYSPITQNERVQFLKDDALGRQYGRSA